MILCLTEARVTADISDVELKILNYSCVRCDSDSRHTGGVLVYVNNGIDYSNCKIFRKEKNFWLVSVKVKLFNSFYILCAFYRSPSGNVREFLNYFESFCEDVMNCNVIIVGDFNFNLLEINGYNSKLLDIIHSSGMQQLINFPTRVTRTSESLVDLLITNQKNLFGEVYAKPKITDHDIVAVHCFTEQKQKLGVRYKTVRKYNELKLNLINSKLIECDWEYDSIDINKIYDVFDKNIVKVVDEVCPEKRVRCKSNSIPWFTDKVLKVKRERDEAYRNYKQSKNLDDWESYKKLRNTVVSVLKSEKSKYFQNQIDNNRNQPKMMWKTLKTLINGKSKETVEEPIFDKSTHININNYDNVASAFNDYFVESVNEIVGNNVNAHLWNTNGMPTISSSFNNFKRITMYELKKIVFGLKNKSSSQIIDACLLKEIFYTIGYPLLNIINKSLETGICPTAVKTSMVVPIPKINGTKRADEFRAINMLPIIEKVIEIAVHSQLLEYFENNKLIYVKQSGFRKNHSCETSVQYLIDEWLKEIDQDKIVVAVFLDLKRAFEIVSRDILIQKLKYYGVNGVVLEWFSSYLHERYQVTKFNNVVSLPKENMHGVPQGSVLGPLLFIIYINDMWSKLTRVSVNLFADDTLLYVSGEHLQQLINDVNEDINLLTRWLGENKLQLNVKKTKAMLITTKTIHRKIENIPNLVINNEKIEWVGEIKYLGVIFDKHLKFSKHYEYLIKKVGKKIGFLSRVSGCLSTVTKITVYNTIIKPHFHYCGTILFLLNDSQIKTLQKLQNKAMRIILRCDKYTSIDFMLKSLKWLSVKELINFNVMIFLYKIKTKVMPEYLSLKIKYNNATHQYATRSGSLMQTNRPNKVLFEKSIFISGIKIFNRLPIDIKDASSLNVFKNKYLSWTCSNL